MKLSEMKRLPKRAGLAKLVFYDEEMYEGRLPSREEDMIVLPKDPVAEFFRLQNGRQFLFHRPSARTWFGGTDENPFLVRMRKEALKVFRAERQKGFYEALKPEIVTEVEEKFDVVSKRQGDIWAVPIPHFWDKIDSFRFFCPEKDIRPRPVKSLSLFHTRHRFTGTYLEPCFLAPFVFAAGIIEASDHSPLELNEIHVLAQTKHLLNAPRAD